MPKSIIPDVIDAASNRRSFIKKIGAATAAVGAMSAGLAPAAEAQTATEMQVLQFALNLEYLEAQAYSYAVKGSNIVDNGVGLFGVARGGNSTAGGTTTGGKKVSFSSSYLQDLFAQIGNDELNHVKLLRTVLGNMKIAQPNINLNALGFGFANETEFMKLSRIFEDIGVTAYAGAAGLLTTPAVITAAARIVAVEAEHVAAVRTNISLMSIATAPALDGVDLIPPPSGPVSQYLSINYNDGLVSTRTPGEVLYLAYGMKANATSGGFFPKGANGPFYTSSAAATKNSSNS